MMPRPANLLLAFALIAIGSQADAALVVNINQVASQFGSDVVVTASGSLNTAGLGFADFSGSLIGSEIQPSFGIISVGPVATEYRRFNAFLSGPSSFGPGAGASTNVGSGNNFAFVSFGNVFFTQAGYQTGAAIFATSNYQGRTIADMGLIQGTYAFSYSATQGGPLLDTITVQVGPAAVPEPASLAMVGLGLAGLGLVARRRKA